MILTRTPLRISFAGGGSDLPDYYNRIAGAVLSTTINKYIYAASHRSFNSDRILIRHESEERVSSTAEIKHSIIRECLQLHSLTGGWEITTMHDIPPGTGLGSSSALAVGILHNLAACRDIRITNNELARQACLVEMEKLKAPVGKQDQYSCAFGGLNMIRFFSCGEVAVEPVAADPALVKVLENNLFLFYIGNPRNAASILTEQKENMKHTKQQKTVQQMAALAAVLKQSLETGNINAFGEIIHENWLMKKTLAGNISNSMVDAVYSRAMSAGATGGKLLGAGAGGFLLFYCPEDRHRKFLAAMQKLPQVSFRFETCGSQVVYKEETV